MKMIKTIIYFTIGLFFPLTGQTQLLSVSGYIKNQVTGDFKKNIIVFETVSGVGTITNTEGYFKLSLNPGKQNLEVSGSGFNAYSCSFDLKADTVLSIQLLPLIPVPAKNPSGLGYSKEDESSPKQNPERKEN
jgi:hypothetical protein